MEKAADLFLTLGNSLDLDETLATLDEQLKLLVGCERLEVHLAGDNGTALAYAAGESRGGPAFPVDLAGTGSLTVYRVRGFSEEERRLLAAVAPKARAAIENARRFERVEKIARGALFRQLDAEIARARRTAGRVAVIQCRHPAIERAAAAIRERCREYDFVALSGADLVLVLPGFEPADYIEKRAFLEAAVEGGVVRTGAAFFPEDGSDTEDLLAVAAERLRLGRARGAVEA